MTDVFVAGALCLPEVLAQVLPSGLDRIETLPARLADHALVLADPAQHPCVRPLEGGEVDGLLLSGLNPEQIAALAFYAETFQQQPKILSVDTAAGTTSALCHLSDPPVGAEVISLAEWARHWSVVAMRMAGEVMAYHGRKPASEMTKSLFAMRIRASAWQAGQARPADPRWDLSRDVVVHAHKREYVNFFAMEEMDLQYRRFDGSLSPVINRGAAMGGSAAVLLPYDVTRDAVLLVEQFRAAIYIGGAANPWLWEPPAGLIDPGETPEDAARREAREEAGLEVAHLERVGGLYPSSGFISEYIHIFCGLTDFSAIEGGGGVPSEGEDIRSKVISFHELMEAVDSCTLEDMPLVTAALWLARHRDRLRAEFG